MTELQGDTPRYWDTFLDTPPNEMDLESCRVVLIPVPYDGTTSYIGGARHGPKSIINASRHLEDYDIELGKDLSTVGIYTAAEIATDLRSPESMINRVEKAVEKNYSVGRIIGLLGGEHSITIGAVRALNRFFPDLSVLCLDAHADLRDEYMGTRWGHASTARRLREVCPVVQVGVRSASSVEISFIKQYDLPVFFWPQNSNIDRLCEDVSNVLSSQIYVSLDLDVFDPSVISAVGTPEPGGMYWDDVISLLKAVCDGRELVGFDISELSPGQGTEACAYTAAKLTYKLIGYGTIAH